MTEVGVDDWCVEFVVLGCGGPVKALEGGPGDAEAVGFEDGVVRVSRDHG